MQYFTCPLGKAGRLTLFGIPDDVLELDELNPPVLQSRLDSVFSLDPTVNASDLKPPRYELEPCTHFPNSWFISDILASSSFSLILLKKDPNRGMLYIMIVHF
jgi:hypothetical protein